MPERSEWLVAGGAAKRNPRYHDTHHYAFEKREYHLLWRPFSRHPDAFPGNDGFPGVALTLNPRLRALRLRPRHSTFQVGYLHGLSSKADNRLLMIYLSQIAQIYLRTLAQPRRG